MFSQLICCSETRGCFHIWEYFNNHTKQLGSRSPLVGQSQARSHSNPGAVCSIAVRTATGANSLDVRCLGTGAKTSLVSMDNMVVSFSVLLSLHVNVGQSVHSPSLFYLFIPYLINLTVFVCGGQVLMRHFTSSPHPRLILLLLLPLSCQSLSKSDQHAWGSDVRA